MIAIQEARAKIKCPHCGGWLFWEYDYGWEWDCVNCASKYRKGTDGKLIGIRKEK